MTKIANQRTILTNEDDDAKAAITERGTKGALSVEILDGSGNQITSFGGQQSGNSTIGDGSQTIATTNTAIQVSTSSVSCRKVLIQAKESNAKVIWIGGSTVASGRGLMLTQTFAQWFTPSNLNLIYINGTAGDGITFLYEN